MVLSAYVLAGLALDHSGIWVLLAAVGASVVFAVLSRYRQHGLRGVWHGLNRRLRQSMALVGVLLIGAAVPTIALVSGTELTDILSDPAGFNSFYESVFVGRLLQLCLITLAALLPAAMYFQFDRHKLTTLRERFIRHMFRLDPTLQTVGDVEARYGSQIDEVYGTVREAGRLVRGHLGPLIVATLAIALGWVISLTNSNAVTGDEVVRITVLDLIVPAQSAVAFGFLGAYFFGLQLIHRGYVRGDLRPKSYNTITVRILAVMILSWLLEAVVGSDGVVFATAFLAGIVPETVLQRISDVARYRGALLHDRAPLTELEGIDLYDRTRLSDEGINNVQALAHHDFIDLMLNTRIPVPRLVDWMDQSLLYLRIGVPEENEDRDGRMPHLNHLRRFGIRTATDFLGVVKEAEGRDNARDPRGDERDRLLRALVPDDDSDVAALRAQTILDAIDDEEWLPYLQNWRRSDLARHDVALHGFLDATGQVQRPQ